MDDDLTVDRGMDIELHAVRSLAGGRTEGGQGVLQRDAGGAPVGNHQRLHCWRLSAFFGSIQSGSFSMSCTTAMSAGRGSTDSRYPGYFASSSGCPSTVNCRCADMAIRRLYFRSGALSCVSRSGMNGLILATSYTIVGRGGPGVIS